ncbi:S8 family serine peptidase [Candidatus Kaiserbacteria bacterium]|nr:S8 family serine peptidase [Candidatus Kaiserbacteria bacterium]
MHYKIDPKQLLRRQELEKVFERELDKGMDVVLPPEIDPIVPYGIQETGNWGFSYLKVQQLRDAWAGKLQRKVGVAIVDTAWKFTHKDLLPYSLNEDGGAFANDKPENGDGHGHGHHCGGLVAAVHPTLPIGIGPAKEGYCYAIPYGGLNSNGSGSLPWLRNAFAAAIETYVKKYKKEGWAWIISNSWGGGSADTQFLELVRQARAEGIIVNASAGNSGFREGQSTVLYPAKYPEVAAIAAIQNNGAPSGFSSAGPEVLFATPGQSIYSTYKDGTYATASGTSMANPIYGGLVAWLLARFPEIKDQEHLEEFVKAYITDAHTPNFDVRTGFGVPVGDKYADKKPEGDESDPPQPPAKRKTFIDVGPVNLQFESRQLGDNLYGYNNWKLFSANLTFRVELEYEADKFQGAASFLANRVEAYARGFDDKTFYSKGDNPQRAGAIELEDATFIGIAEHVREQVQQRAGVKIALLHFQVIDHAVAFTVDGKGQ